MALMLGSASPAPAMTEDELIDAARVGDDRAFAELYARYRERIERYIRARLHDPGRAEDVAQEVFISALRRLRSSDQVIVLKPWLYEIAKNACIDEHRRQQRSREISLDADGELAEGRGALMSIAPTPPVAMESKQKLDDLRGAFGGLSKNHHQLLVMREFEGLSYDEIGRRTGMSRQMVESALFRARRKLGLEYEELASGRRCLQVQTAIEGGKLSAPRALGVRERRQVARHLAHCQGCRVKAQLAGVGERLTRPGVAAKIAALLPFPALRWSLFRRSVRAALRAGSHPGLQARAVNSESGPSALLGGAAVAAVALAIAGGGANPGPPGSASRPAARANASAASNRRDFAPGAGTVAPVPAGRHAGRLRTRSTGDRLGRRQAGSSRATDRGGTGAGSGAPGTSRSPTGADLPLAVPTASAAVTTVTQTLSTVSHVVQGTTQSVADAVAQTPVAKPVSTVLSTAPISNASAPLSGATSPTSVPPPPLGTGTSVTAP